MSDYPLYSVIVDGVEVGSCGSDEDAQMIAGGDIIFIDKPRPSHVEKLDKEALVSDYGYYAKP